jgi:flagellin
MTVINTNVNAIFAKNAITGNARSLSTAMERLSTGSRINSAKDDAAGLAISNRMNSQVRGLSMAIRNANDGISLMQTSEGALSEVSDILLRMRELSVQAVNGSNNASDRVALNDEVQQLKAEIERIATTTTFNNQSLLDGSFKNKELQIGSEAGQTLRVDIGSARLQDLGLGGSSAGSSDAIVSARVAISGSDVEAGDLLINDQALEVIDVSADDMEDIVDNINRNVDNVVASGFNVVVAKQVGDGVTTDGQFDIVVKALGATASTTYSISASSNMQELVDNINAEAGAVVQASINEEGKLVLSNSTGATIQVADGSATAATYDGGSGFRNTAQSFAGFLKLESSDGSPVRVSLGALGSIADAEVLGFRPTVSDFNTGTDAYTIQGEALTETGATTAWGSTDVKINGVAIYDENIDTGSFAGKIEALNSFSDETGVVASAYFELKTTFVATAGALSINGVALTAGVSGDTAATWATKVNNQTDLTGITATVQPGNAQIVYSGNLSSVTFVGTAAVAAGTTTGTTEFAGIRLDSIANTPIAIELGDGSTDAEHGLLEANVGAADFQVNAASLGSGSGGGSLTGLDISTSSGATKALTLIDSAMTNVNAMRSKMGAVQNRLDSTVDNLSNIVANTQASNSRIADTDYAAETSALARAQIIQQAATAMLAQANQQPQTVLSLLQ